MRGINSQQKLTAIKSKILEMNCDIVYLQETKKENFDQSFIKKFYPSTFGNLYHIMVHQVAQSLSRKVVDLLGERLHKTNM
jgi:hypothetical protein